MPNKIRVEQLDAAPGGGGVGEDHVEAREQFAPASSGAWVQVTLPVAYQSKVITVNITNTSGAPRFGGVREKDSLIDRREQLSKNVYLGMTVAVDAAGIIEAYAEDIDDIEFTIHSIIGEI